MKKLLPLLLIIVSTSVMAQMKYSASLGVLFVPGNHKGFDLTVKQSPRLSPFSVEYRFTRLKWLHHHTMISTSFNYEFQLTNKSDSSRTKGLFIEPSIGFMFGKVDYFQIYLRPYSFPTLYIPAGSSSHHIFNSSIRIKYQWSIKNRIIVYPWMELSYRLMSGEYKQYQYHLASGPPTNPLDGFVPSVGISVGYAF